MRLWFVVPVHGRQALTAVCLRQLARTCKAVSRYGLDATAVVVGDDENVDLAEELGFATVRRDNTYLGRRFNDGYQLACDPNYNPEPADYVVPCGSDDWVDPAVFRRLPPDGVIGTFEQMATVNEGRTRLARLRVWYPGGVGVRIIPRSLVAGAAYRPAGDDKERGIDQSTLNGIRAARGRQMPPMVNLDVHPLQIVDWKSSDEQLNPYAGLVQRHLVDELEDPFDALGEFYPAEALEEMRALDLVTA